MCKGRGGGCKRKRDREKNEANYLAPVVKRVSRENVPCVGPDGHVGVSVDFGVPGEGRGRDQRSATRRRKGTFVRSTRNGRGMKEGRYVLCDVVGGRVVLRDRRRREEERISR